MEINNLLNQLNSNNYDILDLLNLLQKGKSSYDICKELHISRDTLFNELKKLKSYGSVITNNYHYDGNVTFNSNCSKTSEICIPSDINFIKFLVISDIHMGNEFEELSLLDNAFEYCEKNGINIILNCGDFIDGKSSNYNQIITDAYHQIEYFLDNYPKSDSIITFGVGGNHDYSIHNKFDIIKACKDNRPDIVIGSYGTYPINLKKDKILLHHKLKGKTNYNSNDYVFILDGHSHMGYYDIDNKLIKVPSLSGLNQSNYNAIELSIDFNNGKIIHYETKNICFKNKDFNYLDGISIKI